MHAPLACLVSGLVTVLVAVAATPARADPLGETLDALARYSGESALQASIEVVVRTGEEGDEDRRSGRVTIRAERSREGLRVLYPPDVLDRLQAEAGGQANGDEADIPVSDVLAELGAGALRDALDYSGSLRQLIEGATVLESKPASDGGLATLQVRAHPSRADAPPFVKESELLVTLSLAEDGVPTVVVTESRVKAGRLFINVTNRHRVRRELARVGDHLIVTRSQGELRVSGLGQSFTKTVDMMIRVDQQPESGRSAARRAVVDGDSP